MLSRSSVRLFVAATFLALAPAAWAQPLQKTLTIDAIDTAKRLLTLKDNDGNVEVVTVGPAVQKFNELKVGGRVQIKYFEPMLAAMRPAGTPAPAPSADNPPNPTDVSATMTVTATDPKAPSVSVKSDAGEALVFKVGDKKVLDALKVGDKLEITYTRSFAIQVDKK